MSDDWEGRIILAGYRALAKKLHPDRGGSEEAMQALNAAVVRLRQAASHLGPRRSVSAGPPRPAPPIFDQELYSAISIIAERIFGIRR